LNQSREKEVLFSLQSGSSFVNDIEGLPKTALSKICFYIEAGEEINITREVRLFSPKRHPVAKGLNVESSVMTASVMATCGTGLVILISSNRKQIYI
jgi:hypothetical protein